MKLEKGAKRKMTAVTDENIKPAYHRLNVYDYIMEFCGWEPLEELTKFTKTNTQNRYILNLIKTGGRAGEVLGLQKENFAIVKRQKIILCSNMQLEKRYKVKCDPLTKKPILRPNGKRETIQLNAIRKPFPILLEEPLSKELLEANNQVEQGQLFTSPYKQHKPLTVSWGYKFIRNLNDCIPKTLFNQLGLNQPFRDKLTGNTISDTIHLWQHWARAQRASQLRSEYGFTEADLMEYFGWLDYNTALHYSRLGASNLAKKMRAAIR